MGGDFVSLTWAKPSSDGGGKINGFWVDKREHGKEDWVRVNPQICITNMINIPNLIEDKRYEFRVFAENGAGLSPPSVASNSIKIKDPNGKFFVNYLRIALTYIYQPFTTQRNFQPVHNAKRYSGRLKCFSKHGICC